MCALVLAMRKIPILGPGGGGPALGDPSNPSYSVAVGDEMAAAARDRAAKDVDAARLYPTIVAQSEEAEKSREGGKSLSPISEDMAADALNGMRQSEEALKDDEEKADSYDIVRTQNDTRSSTGKRSRNAELQKSKSP